MLAARKLFRKVAFAVEHAYKFKRVECFFLGFCSWHFLELQRHHDVVEGVEWCNEVETLKNKANGVQAQSCEFFLIELIDKLILDPKLAIRWVNDTAQ